MVIPTISHCFNFSQKDHPEPWIIAMDCDPSKYRILDYGMRWGIECMFLDLKSRGFSIIDTHVQKTDRLERLMLILIIALYRAVSIRMTPNNPEEKKYFKKNSTDLPALPLNTDYEL